MWVLRTGGSRREYTEGGRSPKAAWNLRYEKPGTEVNDGSLNKQENLLLCISPSSLWPPDQNPCPFSLLYNLCP